jgi:hypothetical protein
MRGGALQRIGRLTPEITGPEELKANCDVMYLCAHGLTNMKSLFIVPENTFIVFTGRSAYATSAYREATKLLFNRDEDVYANDMYSTFFKEGPSPGNMELNRLLRPYPDAYVYTPGDLIHNMNLNFNTFLGDFVIRLGLYHLPLTAPEEFNLSGAELLIPFLINYTRDRRDLQKFITMKINPEMEEKWGAMKKFEYPSDIINHYIQNYHNKVPLSQWFESPAAIQAIMDTIISPFAMRTEQFGSRNENLIPVESLKPEKGGGITTLVKLLKEYPSEKKYRFMIISACRPPDVDPSPSPEINTIDPITTHDPDPQRLPAGASLARRRLRRASFSAKGADVVCPIGTGMRPMNLGPIKDLINRIGDTEFPKKEEGFIKNIKFTFFVISDSAYIYRNSPIILVGFGNLIDNLYRTYPLLESNEPEDQGRKEMFSQILLTTRAVFDPYLRGLVRNVGLGNGTLRNIFMNKISPALAYAQERKEEVQKGLTNAGIGGRRRKTRKPQKRRRHNTRRYAQSI